MAKIVIKKKSKLNEQLEKSIHMFEFVEKLEKDFVAEGFTKPSKPEEPLDFTRLDDMVGSDSGVLGELLILYTRWFGYAHDMEAWASAKVAIYNKCTDICRSELMLMTPKDLKGVMEAKVELHPVMKKYNKKLLEAKTKCEMYKSMTRSIGRAVDTVSREMTRRNNL